MRHAYLSQILDNGRVGVKQVIAGHARLAGDASRDNDNIGTLQGVRQLGIANMASHLQDFRKTAIP